MKHRKNCRQLKELWLELWWHRSKSPLKKDEERKATLRCAFLNHIITQAIAPAIITKTTIAIMALPEEFLSFIYDRKFKHFCNRIPSA
jgi:hypothetical protein